MISSTPPPSLATLLQDVLEHPTPAAPIPPPELPTHRKCFKCKEVKASSQFYKSIHRGVQVLSSQCKPCAIATSAAAKKARLGKPIPQFPAKKGKGKSK